MIKIPCIGCPVIAICRVKSYLNLLRGCSKISNLINFTTRISSYMILIKKTLNPVYWKYEINKINSGNGRKVVILGVYGKVGKYDRTEVVYLDYSERK